jgi:pimeloyl-ACP methyl ester carboxylesterase
MKMNWCLTLWAAIVWILIGCGDRLDKTVNLQPAGSVKLDVSLNFPDVETVDHEVPHVSTVPANAGELVYLHLRERRAVNRDNPKVVLMIHGASVPVQPGFDLSTDHYDYALALSQSAGFDVFMLDFQGAGLSPRPKMDDPCNAPTSDQTRALIPNPLAATCPPSYPFQLINSQSDWAELDTVVDYIRTHRGVDKVALISWSQGSFRIGPYAVQHPEKVESLLFYAPIYNPAFRSGVGPGGFAPPVALPQPGTPMSIRTKGDLLALWNAESRCEGQLEEGVQDIVWDAIMDSEPVGRNWGPPPVGAPEGSAPEGVLRVRTPFLWGWNESMASRVTVPVLIIAGEFDRGDGGIQKLAELYQTVQSTNKLRFTVQCAGHRMVWESQRRVLHHISKEWINHGSVGGFDMGEFFVDTEGNLTPM